MPRGLRAATLRSPFEDEAFYVLAGEMTVNVGGQSLVLGAGSIGNVPRNTVHSFKVTSEEVCHVLNFYTPPGSNRRSPAARGQPNPARCRPWASTRRTRS